MLFKNCLGVVLYQAKTVFQPNHKMIGSLRLMAGGVNSVVSIILAYQSHASEHARLWLLSPPDHRPIRTATTHIGSSCACSGSQSLFGLVLEDGLGQSKAVPDSHPKPIKPLFLAVATVMTKWSTSGHLILITRLLSLSKIRSLFRAFYTMRYIDDAKGCLYFREVLFCFTI